MELFSKVVVLCARIRVGTNPCTDGIRTYLLNINLNIFHLIVEMEVENQVTDKVKSITNNH